MKYEKGTFVIVPNLKYLKGLPCEAVSLFVYICSYADDDGVCYPSRNRLSKDMSVTPKTVDKYLLLLVEKGFITKTTRKDSETGGNKSNLYQIENISNYPSVKNDTTPSVKNDTLTIPTKNHTHITISSEEEPKRIETGKLPEHRGKTYILRLLSIYRDLFREKFGYNPTVDIPRWGKSCAELIKTRSELQISALLITFFNWRGMTGDDQYESDRLTKSANPFQMFFYNVNQYEAHLRNVQGLKFDDEDEVLKFVGNYMVKIKK